MDSYGAALQAAAGAQQTPGAGASLDPFAVAAVNPFDLAAIEDSLGNPADGTPSVGVRVRAVRQFWQGDDPWSRGAQSRADFLRSHRLFDFVGAEPRQPLQEAVVPEVRGVVSGFAELASLQSTREGAVPATGGYALAELALGGGRRPRPASFTALPERHVDEPYVGHASGDLPSLVRDMHEAERGNGFAAVVPALTRGDGESDASHRRRVDPAGTLSGDVGGSRLAYRVSRLVDDFNRQAEAARVLPAEFARSQLSSHNTPEHADFLRAALFYAAHHPHETRLPNGYSDVRRDFTSLVRLVQSRHMAYDGRAHPLAH